MRIIARRTLDTYLESRRKHADHERALSEIESLWGAPVGSPRGDKLDVLATLVEAYETRHFSINPPDPISAIEFRMEQQGLTRKDLEEIIGSRGRIAEVLSGKRDLSIKMIRRLHESLGIAAEVLIKQSSRNAA